jgi:hypothetical protein
MEKQKRETSPHEKEGKRLLVGKYVLFKGKVSYVKALYGNNRVDLVEIQSKKEHTTEVTHDALTLIEKFGVNVFPIN